MVDGRVIGDVPGLLNDGDRPVRSVGEMAIIPVRHMAGIDEGPVRCEAPVVVVPAVPARIAVIAGRVVPIGRHSAERNADGNISLAA